MNKLPVIYTLQELKDLDNKVVVYLENKYQWGKLVETSLFHMTSEYRGQYCYSLSRKTFSSSSSKTYTGSYGDVKIIYFNQINFNQTSINKRDFTIEGSEALKKAFVEESGLNNSDIFWNLFLTPSNVKEKALTCTAYKQYIHFILPSQWDEAIKYVKEYFTEPQEEIAIGDWVTILKSEENWCDPDMNEYVGKTYQVTSVDNNTDKGSIIKFKNDGDWEWTSGDKHFRLATTEEIASTLTFKIGQYTAIINPTDVEIIGRGSIFHADFRRMASKLLYANFECGGYTVNASIDTIDIGCVKEVPFKDFKAVYDKFVELYGED